MRWWAIGFIGMAIGNLIFNFSRLKVCVCPYIFTHQGTYMCVQMGIRTHTHTHTVMHTLAQAAYICSHMLSHRLRTSLFWRVINQDTTWFDDPKHRKHILNLRLGTDAGAPPCPGSLAWACGGSWCASVSRAHGVGVWWLMVRLPAQGLWRGRVVVHGAPPCLGPMVLDLL